MLSMTEEEARTILKSNGWIYHERSRRSLGTKYLYAARRQGLKMIERYICPLSRLGDLTEQQLVAKLAPQPTEPSSTEGEPEVNDTTSPPSNTDVS